MSSLTVFRRVAPEFAAVSDAEVNEWFSIAVAAHTASVWGAQYQLAMVLYSAHLLKDLDILGATGAGTGTAGPIASRKKGDLSESYANVAGSASSAAQAIMMTTAYGRAYVRILLTRSGARARLITPG